MVLDYDKLEFTPEREEAFRRRFSQLQTRLEEISHDDSMSCAERVNKRVSVSIAMWELIMTNDGIQFMRKFTKFRLVTYYKIDDLRGQVETNTLIDTHRAAVFLSINANLKQIIEAMN